MFINAKITSVDEIYQKNWAIQSMVNHCWTSVDRGSNN